MTPRLNSNAGVAMPAIVYGTAWKEDRTADLVEAALDCGFRGIDTACQPKHYNEPGVGEGIQRALNKGLNREDLFIQTKFTGIQGQDPTRVPYDPSLPIREQVLQSVAVSHKNLGANPLDSLVLHGPLSTWEDTVEAWRALEEVKKNDGARQIGLSNVYNPKMLIAFLELAEEVPSVLQNRFYRDSEYDIELRKICAQNGIYYQCFWTLSANPHILNSPTEKLIAADLNKTAAQVFFRFVHELGIQILTGTTDPTHMQQDLDIFNFQLTQDQFEQIKPLGPF
ncbi:MAG: aldo/keto reductase [Bdellovibrionales bacterium]